MLELMHFRDAYGLSPERMYAESPIDRAEVVRLRRSGMLGRSKAIRYVRRYDPVPASVAASFVDRLAQERGPSAPAPPGPARGAVPPTYPPQGTVGAGPQPGGPPVPGPQPRQGL